jgi:hypothetical protein
VVHGVGVPAPLLPPCGVVPEWSILGSDFLDMDGAPVPLARRGRRRAPSFLPLLLSRPWNRGRGKSPKQMVGDQQGGSSSWCRHPVKAVQGKRCRGAWGLDARVEGQCGRASMAVGAPVGVAPEGKGVFSPWGIPQASTRAQQLVVRAGRAVRPSHPARANAAGRAHGGVEREKVRGRR